MLRTSHWRRQWKPFSLQPMRNSARVIAPVSWCSAVEGPCGTGSPFVSRLGVPQFGYQVLQAVVADARASRHSGYHHAVAYLPRGVAYGGGHAGLAVFFGVFGSDHGDGVGKLFEDLG